MNQYELIKDIRERTERNIEAVKAVPETLSLDFVSNRCVFIEELETWEEYLVESAKCPLDSEVKSYYMSGDRLAICHSITEDVSVSFFVREYEYALDMLTGGTCKVITTSHPRTHQSVACVELDKDA